MPFDPTPDEDRKVQIGTAPPQVQAMPGQTGKAIGTGRESTPTPMSTGTQQGGNPYASLLHQKPTGPAIGEGRDSMPHPTGYNDYQPTPGASSMPGESGPSATGFVNFDRLYNANAGTANREAMAKQSAAQKQAAGAQSGLAGLQSQFNSADMAMGGPSQHDRDVAAGTYTFDSPASSQGHDVATKQFGDSGGLEQAQTKDQWLNEMKSKANSPQYSGPSALSAMDQYSKLAQDTEAAQQGLDTLPNEGKSGNSIDQDLLGAAGRPGNMALQGRYGNMTGALDKANQASVAQDKEARNIDTANRGLYSDLLTQFGNIPKPAAPVDTAIHIGAAPGVGGSDTTLGYESGLSDPSQAETWGGSDPEQAANNQFGEGGRGAKGSNYWNVMKSWGVTPSDTIGDSTDDQAAQDILKQTGPISPQEWAQLSGMTDK